MSTPRAQILVSKSYFPIKVTEFLGEVTDSKSWLEKLQVESGHFMLAESKEVFKKQYKGRL